MSETAEKDTEISDFVKNSDGFVMSAEARPDDIITLNASFKLNYDPVYQRAVNVFMGVMNRRSDKFPNYLEKSRRDGVASYGLGIVRPESLSPRALTETLVGEERPSEMSDSLIRMVFLKYESRAQEAIITIIAEVPLEIAGKDQTKAYMKQIYQEVRKGLEGNRVRS